MNNNNMNYYYNNNNNNHKNNGQKILSIEECKSMIRDNDSKLDAVNKKSWLLTIGLVVLAIITIFLTLIQLRRTQKSQIKDYDQNTKEEQFRLLSSAITTLGILMWPIIWDKIIGIDILGKMPFLWTAFLFPVILSVSDIMYNSQTLTTSQKHTEFQSGYMSMNGNSMFSIAVAIGTFITNVGCSTKVGSFSKTLISYAMFLLLIFVDAIH